MEKLKRLFLIFIQFFTRKPGEVVKKRKRRVGRQKTIRETLSNLDYHFSRLRYNKDLKFSENDWSTRRALKKIGPYVVPPGYKNPDDSKILHDKRPAIMFVAPDTMEEHENVDEYWGGKRVVPEFYYATMQKRTPWNVQWTKEPGLIYEIGIAYASPVSRKKKETYWLVYFVKIVGNRAVALKFRYNATAVLPNGITFPQKKWTYGNVADPLDGEQQHDPYQWVSETAHNIFNFWDAKREMWAIIVKKGGRRMNFSIPARDTKYYFKDRVKVLLPSGRTKPIIHYVRGFTRTNGQVVMPHIRGLRQFFWNGYSVNVKNPELAERGLVFDEFNVPGEEVNDHDTPEEWLTMPEVATRLSAVDDAPERNIAEIKKRVKYEERTNEGSLRVKDHGINVKTAGTGEGRSRYR